MYALVRATKILAVLGILLSALYAIFNINSADSLLDSQHAIISRFLSSDVRENKRSGRVIKASRTSTGP